MSNSEGKVYPIVVRYAGIVSTIITDVAVIVDGVPHFVKAMWDTGANRTSLSSKLVEELRIVSGGTRSVQYHKGVEHDVEWYPIDLMLPNGVTIKGIPANKSILDGMEFNVIIGMDIIKDGDFSISNLSGKTVFSFVMKDSQ